MDSNYTFKIILVGDSNAGKTSYFNRLMNYEYTEHEVSTIGVDFGVFYRNINNNSVRIHLWDTAGQEKYHSLIRSYLRDGCAYIIMVDLTENHNFKSINRWKDEIRNMNYCDHEHPILLLGNKHDLIIDYNSKEYVEFAKKNNMIYHEISAKENENTEYAFENFISQIYISLCCKKKRCRGIRQSSPERRLSISSKKNCCY